MKQIEILHAPTAVELVEIVNHFLAQGDNDGELYADDCKLQYQVTNNMHFCMIEYDHIDE